MQPGYPGSGQEPYGTQPPYPDPYAQPRYSAGGQADRQPAPSPEPEERPPPAEPSDPTGPSDRMEPAGEPAGAQPHTPPPAAAPPNAGANTLGFVGMVLGIVSIPSAFCTVLGVPSAILCGALAIGFGIAGARRARAGTATNRSQSITAIVCGAVGVVIGLIGALAITYNGAA